MKTKNQGARLAQKQTYASPQLEMVTAVVECGFSATGGNDDSNQAPSPWEDM